MFILRRLLEKNTVESNTFIGDSYNIVTDLHDEQFADHFNKYFHLGEYKEAGDVEYVPKHIDEMRKSIYAFVTYNNGMVIQPLYLGQYAYIMGPNGTTFSNITSRKDRH